MFLTISTTPISAYEEPTDEQLKYWWVQLTTEQRLGELRKLDRIENTPPTLTEPRLVLIQTTKGKIKAYFDGPLIVNIADYIEYEINLPKAELRIAPKPNISPYLWAGGGVVVGAGLTLLICMLSR